MPGKRLSLCMIVRNEADWIARCLMSVKAAVDEMIIVDTGSTDNTIEIAKVLGAQVYDFPWTGHFAEARNYGLNQATGDWILWLDADEEVDAASAMSLRNVLDMDDKQLASIKLINYHGANPPHSDHAYLLGHHRLFRNGMGLQFRNSIHEQLNVNEHVSLSDIPLIPVKVHHYGYLDAVTTAKHKFERNLTMLQAAINTPDHDPWLDYHLASEYFRIADYRQAFTEVNKSIIQFLNKGQAPPSMLYKLKYAALLALGSHDGAWPAIEKAILIYPDYVDLHFYKGLTLFQKDMFDEALEAFQMCLTLGEDNLNYLTLKGLGSFQAMYYVGRCYEKQNKSNQAIDAYYEALKLSPEFNEAREAYTRLWKSI